MSSSHSPRRASRAVLFVFIVGLAGVLTIDAPRAQLRTPTLAITGASIVARPGADAVLGTIVITNSTITAVGSAAAVPPGATVIDAEGLVAYAGFLDADTSVGARSDGRDRVSGSPRDIDQDLTRQALAATRSVNRKGIFPDYAVGQNLRISQRNADRWRAAGFTAIHSMPTDALLAGTSAVALLLDSTDAPGTRAIVDADTMLVAGWRAPGDDYPRSLMGSIAHLRQTFLDAQHYRTLWDLYRETDGASRRPDYDFALDIGALLRPERAPDDAAPTAEEQLERLRELFAQARSYVDRQDQATQAGQRPVLYDPTLEALIPYARGEQSVILSANSAAAILVAIDLAAELDIRAILRGGQEAWRVTDEISEAGLPVLLSPLTRSPSDPYDPYDSVHQSPLRLHEAGILFGFQSNSGAGSRELPFHAGMAVAFGLPPEVALRSVTLSTAEILGIDDQVGSLDVGKRADIIITDGDPLQAVSNVKYMFIAGQPVDVDDNKHTRLYRQYQQRLGGQ